MIRKSWVAILLGWHSLMAQAGLEWEWRLEPARASLARACAGQDPRAAIESCSAALEADSEPDRRAVHYFNRAMAQKELKDAAAALNDLNQSLALRPRHTVTRLLRADLRAARGLRDGALADLREVLAASDTDGDQLSLAAEILERLGEPERAIATMNRAVAEHPNDTYALNNRCWMLAFRNQDLKQAHRDCKRAIELEPSEPAFHDSLGLVLLRMGRLQAAVASYDHAMAGARSGGSPTSHFGRGLALGLLARDTEAQHALARARALDPEIDALFAKAGLYPAAPR